MAIAVIAGFDAVDLSIEIGLEFLDIHEIMEALLVGIIGHREGVFGAFEICANRFDRAVIAIGPDVVFH